MFLPLRGEPVLLHTVRPFLADARVFSVVIALSPEDARDPPPWLAGLDPRVRIVPGGATRGESVGAALEALDSQAEIVLVHDAARPLVTRAVIDRCIEGASHGEGAVAGWPVVDSLKRVDGEGVIVAAPDRSGLWQAQTPQAFPREALLSAYRNALRAGVVATDDASLFSLGGGTVRMVKGSPWNLKITHPEDLAIAESLLRLADPDGEGR